MQPPRQNASAGRALPEVFFRARFLPAQQRVARWAFEDVAQAPRRLDEEVAWENVARVLDDDVLAAQPVERTERVVAADAIAENGVEVTDTELLRPECHPAVEHPAQEVPVLLRRDGELGNRAGLRVHLHARNELQVSHAKIDQEIEDLVGAVGGERLMSERMNSTLSFG
jgi:hypothetical protein